jgi:hypothetical protein
MSATLQQQDPTHLPAMVTLSIGQWGAVLDYIGKQPWNEVNPLMVSIHRQVQDSMRAQTSTAPEPEQATRAAPAD